MQGRRVYASAHGDLTLHVGDYGQCDGYWWARSPVGGVSIVSPERVIEHGYGTISVRGALRLPRWSGRLEHGNWIEYADESTQLCGAVTRISRIGGMPHPVLPAQPCPVAIAGCPELARA